MLDNLPPAVEENGHSCSINMQCSLF